MLVLTRKVKERILIDGGITITVTAINGNKVQLGIEAPKGVGVNREEVAQRSQEQPR